MSGLPADLIERLCMRDEDAARELFSLTKSRFMALVRSLGLSYEDAEEVVADAFFKIWRRGRLKGPEHFVGSMVIASRCLAIDCLRKKRRDACHNSVRDTDVAVEATTESDLLEREAGRAGGRLDADLRDLMRAYDLEIVLRSYPESRRAAVREAITLRPGCFAIEEGQGNAIRSTRLRALARYAAILRSLPPPQVALSSKVGRRLLAWEGGAGATRSPARLGLFHLPPGQQELFARILMTIDLKESTPEIRLRETLLALVRLGQQTTSAQMRIDMRGFIDSVGLRDFDST